MRRLFQILLLASVFTFPTEPGVAREPRSTLATASCVGGPEVLGRPALGGVAPAVAATSPGVHRTTDPKKGVKAKTERINDTWYLEKTLTVCTPTDIHLGDAIDAPIESIDSCHILPPGLATCSFEPGSGQLIIHCLKKGRGKAVVTFTALWGGGTGRKGGIADIQLLCQ